GESIQAKGIEPDILVELARLEPLEGYGSENFRYERDLHNALDDGDEATEDEVETGGDADGEEATIDGAEGSGEDASGADEGAQDGAGEGAGEGEGEGSGEGDGETDDRGADAAAEEEEFFDFQLVRARDLIRGIALYQN
ncbi:MAG: hypothetical protein VXX01_02140, partial [Pseudomonadota bacterium]|nr:hypothetical protein [Pseudomonadota bacterium]